ncbi:MAG: alpha-amylase family glycosyl hydrolase [Bacteroidota bacterium]
MDKKSLLRICIFFTVQFSLAQTPEIIKCEPPNWWIGMKMNKVQLMVYGEHLNNITVTSSSSHLKVLRTHSIANPSYTFIDIDISPLAKPGNYELTVTSRNGKTSFRYPLLKREKLTNQHQGFDQSDVMYLITPDRFANGDTTNDNVAGMFDSLKRSEPFGRHGGDLQGIINKLEYLNDLGVTALWINPLVENNMNRASYHGYSATDLYAIDSRFGTNMLYTSFVEKAHAVGLKVIMDHVNNHIGTNHPWLKNLPTADWLNGTIENHQRPFHSKPELDDIHSDSLTRQQATNGWFDRSLADVNQQNPFVANYLKQNTIWWIEFSGMDGIREDTYPYIDPKFREEWCKSIMDEYPRFNIVGEVWVQDPAFLAPYQRGSFIPRSVKPELPSLTDFGLYDAFMKTFADSNGTIGNVFNTLAKDFLYPDPDNLVTFLDNHDITRIMYNVNGDVKRFKLAMLALLTTRGIPQLLYGTEIGMKGGKDHGLLRADFPGGFPNDTRDAFTEPGRTQLENELFKFSQGLLQIRKSHKSLQFGTLIHFKPSHETYVYFRILKNERMMVVINHHKEEQKISLSPYTHQLKGVTRLRDLVSGKEFSLIDQQEITLEGMTGGIFEIVDVKN